MKFRSDFDCGDTVYAVVGVGYAGAKVTGPLTVGQIRLEYTNTIRTGDPDTIFDNYKPKKSHKESYMMVETGIGTGSVYQRENLFTTLEAATERLKELENE